MSQFSCMVLVGEPKHTPPLDLPMVIYNPSAERNFQMTNLLLVIKTNKTTSFFDQFNVTLKFNKSCRRTA